MGGRVRAVIAEDEPHARQSLRDERPDAAMQSLMRLAAAERLPREHEAQVHLLLAESIDAVAAARFVQGIAMSSGAVTVLGAAFDGSGRPMANAAALAGLGAFLFERRLARGTA